MTVTDPLLVAPSGSLTGGPIATLAPGAVDTATFSGKLHDPAVGHRCAECIEPGYGYGNDT
ncbi:hypothetical protein [Nonlabens agnitus]|uniref:hypothetical protein n=1 Tax=Nonlabens agnitus TaxID=870484 RepID=UPI0011B29C0A|nr:hypothetical protein [Nonlabens agnitus]